MSEGSSTRQNEEKKPERTIADLPSYEGDLSKLPKIREVKIFAYDYKKYYINFHDDDNDYDYKFIINDLSEHSRKILASIFNAENKQIKYGIIPNRQVYYKFTLHNIEGNIVTVCSDVHPIEELRGDLFICSVNHMALTQKLLDAKDFVLCDNSLYS